MKGVNVCNGMVGVNRNTSVPKSVLCYVLEKGHVLRSGILFLSFLVL